MLSMLMLIHHELQRVESEYLMRYCTLAAVVDATTEVL